MQTTFLKLHRARDSYCADRPLKPWLFTIAASVRRDELRRRYRLPPHVGEIRARTGRGAAARRSNAPHRVERHQRNRGGARRDQRPARIAASRPAPAPARGPDLRGDCRGAGHVAGGRARARLAGLRTAERVAAPASSPARHAAAAQAASGGGEAVRERRAPSAASKVARTTPPKWKISRCASEWGTAQARCCPACAASAPAATMAVVFDRSKVTPTRAPDRPHHDPRQAGSPQLAEGAADPDPRRRGRPPSPRDRRTAPR